MYYHKEPILTHLLINPEEQPAGYAVDTIPTERMKRISGTYLHGKLQEICGYDCFLFVDHVPSFTGIFPVKVLTKEVGVTIDATLYLWTSENGIQGRGFVVANDDADAIHYAQLSYTNRKQIL